MYPYSLAMERSSLASAFFFPIFINDFYRRFFYRRFFEIKLQLYSFRFKAFNYLRLVKPLPFPYRENAWDPASGTFAYVYKIKKLKYHGISGI